MLAFGSCLSHDSDMSPATWFASLTEGSEIRLTARGRLWVVKSVNQKARGITIARIVNRKGRELVVYRWICGEDCTRAWRASVA